MFSPPLISRNEAGIIGRSTINVIQGPFGSHKSRIAELFAALMLTDNDTDDPEFLGFKKAMLERFCVCYIDTERNQTEELPYAIQGIKTKAGYRLEDQPKEFRFTSIKGEQRKDRFKAIETFIGHVRNHTALHLFCLIDVVTDAIGDFNDPQEAMKLFDFLGNLCDNYDATFMLVIHQNPGTEKARGHAGTEAANKASTAMQIGFEKDAGGNDTDLIRLRFLKLRRGKRPEPVYLQYSEEHRGLLLATADQVTDHFNQRTHKADVASIANRLQSLLEDGPQLKGTVVNKLMEEFEASERTIRNRLTEISEQKPQMYNNLGQLARLHGYRDTKEKKEYYSLVAVE